MTLCVCLKHVVDETLVMFDDFTLFKSSLTVWVSFYKYEKKRTEFALCVRESIVIFILIIIFF